MPKQRTPAQQEAARRNGAKSRGPFSRTGRSTVTNPELLAKTVVIRGEDPARFLTLLAELRLELNPSGPLQESLVEDLATCRWRQRRLLGMESAFYTGEIARQLTEPNPADSNAGRAVQALNSVSRSHSLDYINRYELRFVRQINRTLDKLHALQAKAAASSHESENIELPRPTE
jgi:hypothetical protein